MHHDDFDNHCDEPEGPDENDLDLLDDESPDVMPCPHCGAEIYEDSPRCGVCDQYVTHTTHALDGGKWWWLLPALLGIAAVIWIILAL